MAERIRTTAPPAMPPLRAVGPAAPARGCALDAPRLARLGLCLAALALPVLGSAAADTVHRVGLRGASQTAALPFPTGRTAVPTASRSVPVLREASLGPARAGLVP